MEMAVFWFIIGLGIVSLMITVRSYFWRERGPAFRIIFMAMVFSTLVIFIIAIIWRLFSSQ